MFGQNTTIGQALQRLARFAKQMGHRCFNLVEVAIPFRDLVEMKFRQMFLSLESLLAGPALPDLLQEEVPFSFMPITGRRLGAEIAEGIAGQRPSLQVPAAGLSIRTADPLAVLLLQSGHGRLAVHGCEQFQPEAVQAEQRQMIIQRRQPPFVGGVLIRHHVGHSPGPKLQQVVGQLERFLDRYGRFHELFTPYHRKPRSVPRNGPGRNVLYAPEATTVKPWYGVH